MGGLNKLSLLGKPQSFSHPIHVGRPNLGDRDGLLSQINQMLDRRWFTNDGPLVREFEKRVCEVTGAKHCVVMCNATVALEIAIRALDLHGEVIIPSFTFVATAHALQWQQITPVFADIDPGTHTLDIKAIERLITPRTTGIIGVHTWGRACDIEALRELGERRGLKVMFDAAHAFGCTHHGRMIGGFGACEVFSFHATKFISCFEGGAVTTNDDVLAEKMRLMRNFGFSGYDRVIYLGINGKMTEVCAAMGLTSLDAMEDIIAINRRNYEHYQLGLEGIPGISLIAYDPREKNNFHYMVVEVDRRESPLSRDDLIAVLHAENVLARKYFWPGCHKMEPYQSLQPNAYLLLQQTEWIASRVIILPTGQEVSGETIRIICSIIREAMAKAPEIKAALA